MATAGAAAMTTAIDLDLEALAGVIYRTMAAAKALEAGEKLPNEEWIVSPPTTLLKAYEERGPSYMLFQPPDMPNNHWKFILEALTFAERLCECTVSEPSGHRQ
jgi:hypothetical protein